MTLTATEPDMPIPFLGWDDSVIEFCVGLEMFPFSLPLSEPSCSTSRILVCQLDRSELLCLVPSEPWVPPVPGFHCLESGFWGLELLETFAPARARLPMKP